LAAENEAAGTVQLPGVCADGIAAADTLQATALEIDQDGRKAGIYITRNPDKLRHLEAVNS
jgi:RNA polymerase sigma-70 factor (ECF subfamily)